MSINLVSCMETFISVAKYGSFTKTARENYIAVSTITKQIQLLETYLAVPLITRTTRALKLTPAGDAFLKSAQKILQDIQNSKDSIKNLTNPAPTGSIRISLPGFFQQGKYIELIGKFLKQYPGITLKFNNSDISPIQLLEGTADIVISRFKLNEKQFNRDHLFSLTANVYASPLYLKQYGIPNTIYDLKQHNCLIYKASSPINEWKFGKNISIAVQGNYQVINGLSLIPAAVAGIGLTWIFDIFVENEVKQNQLIKLNFEQESFKMDISIYYLPLGYTGNVKLFVQWLKHELQQLT